MKRIKEIIYCDIDNTVANELDYYLNHKKKIPNYRYFKPISFSKSSIKILTKKFQVYWVSARSIKKYNETKLWLKKNGFPIKNINLLGSNNKKIKFLTKQKKFYCLIDDMKYNYQNLKPKLMTKNLKILKKNKIRVILFENNWIKIREKLTN